MDKIGEAIKPLTASFLDLLEVERRKKEDNDQTMMVYQPRSKMVGPRPAATAVSKRASLKALWRLILSPPDSQQKNITVSEASWTRACPRRYFTIVLIGSLDHWINYHHFY